MRETTITLTTSDGPMGAFLAIPDGEGPFPAVVVAQEAFGVNAHIRDVAARFARAGYVAMAPELFHRTGHGLDLAYEDFSKVRPHFSKVTADSLTVDLRAAIAHLRALPGVAPSRIGAVGFCMGGYAAFLAACRTDVQAVVSFYGGGIVHARPGLGLQPILDEAENVSCPLLCLFGADDKSIPPDQVEAIRGRLSSTRCRHEVVVYPGAGHAFFCDARSSYQKEAADDAWTRTLDWFGAALAK